jgi:hypothetical protein
VGPPSTYSITQVLAGSRRQGGICVGQGTGEREGIGIDAPFESGRGTGNIQILLSFPKKIY